MKFPVRTTERVFRTAWFTRSAKKARIADDELCEAIKQVRKGQADDQGGGVFKRRLNRNMHRSIVLGKGGRYWVYVYLFAKKDRDNIEDGELDGFREMADFYAKRTDAEIDAAMQARAILEICNDNQT